MESIAEIYKKTGALHHCYIITGDVALNREELEKFCQSDLKISFQGNPDVLVFDSPSFSVGEARELVERQLRTAAEADGRKLFLIVSDFFTREAQNALLKVLEEPTAQTHFFVLTQSLYGLLPTLLSRATVVSGQQSIKSSQAKKFLSSNIKERLELTKEIVEVGDKREVINLLDSLEQVIYGLGGVKQNTMALEKINHFRPFLYDRGASMKMILEYLASTLPVIR